MSNTYTLKKSAAHVLRPYRHQGRVVVAIPKALVDAYAIDPQLTELVITPEPAGFVIRLQRRGDFT